MKTEIKELIITPVRDPDKFDYFEKEDEERFVALIKECGAISLYLYSGKVLTDKGIRWIDKNDTSARTVSKGGAMYVPSSFFREHLGVEASLGEEPLPLVKTCRDLGIFAEVYNDGLLAVVGGEAMDRELKNYPRLVYAGSYATLGGYDSKSFTSSDYEAARASWRKFLVGTFETNDLTIPEVKEKVEAAERKYEESRKKFNRDENAVILFGSAPPKISYDLWWQYEFLESFAIAWAMPGSKYYRDEAILDDILFGLEWMYENMYGEAEIEERGWRSVHDFDWCDWFVRGPDPLTNTMLLLGEHVSMEKRQTYLRCFRWVVSFMRQGYIHPSATSRIRVCTKAALLLEDAQWMENEFYDYDLLCEINERGEGALIDYSHVTHGYPYNLMYGLNNLERVMYVGRILSGTPVEFTSPKQYNLFRLLKYMYEPILYKGRAAVVFFGRGNGSTEITYGSKVIMQTLPMIGLFGEEEDLCIKRFIKRNSVLPEVAEAIKRSCPISEVKKYVDILNDESIPYCDSYEFAHAYFIGGRAAQQRGDYQFTLAMPTREHQSYESCNEANRFGWFTGEGAIYLSTKNDNHTFDGGNFAIHERVMMSIPGTTRDTQRRMPWSYTCVTSPRGYRDFVGALSVNEKYVTAAMDYEAYHLTGEAPERDDGYGGKAYPHTDDLTAKKAYFMLDRECICLGAGITSTTGYPVETVIENRNLIIDTELSRGCDRTAIDGVALTSEDSGETVYQSPSYISLENVGGYVLLDKAELSVEKYTVDEINKYQNGKLISTKKSEAPKRYFKLCIEHGENPKNATYAYAILPYADDSELKEYAASKSVKILSNTPECQAISKESIGISSYVFYTPGVCGEITADAPCIVTVLEECGEYKLTLSDPTKKLDRITLRISHLLTPKSLSHALKVTSGPVTTLEFNVKGAQGKPHTAVFEAK